ncbi:hypothetical protein BD410DRAFT_210465 [Rickenella mellea]|uniref:Uncharacterized protein n=1 Tax=Rickenella mellea TaxID=50990 RepID=A0A4Y7Q4W6_9AGAM|nr:hypothetical protein BD410DRAFT_210465 [Rickenella mellea]
MATHVQIADQEAALVALTLERDAHCFINSLPQEIIIHIFHLLQIPGSLRWLVVTWICRIWRQVALECPSLWTYIRLSNAWPQEVSTFIRRAKSSPLTVHTYPTSYVTDHGYFTGFLLEHLSRAREVWLKTFLPPPPADHDIDLQTIFSTPAPLLEKVNICRPWESWDVKPPPFRFGSNLPLLCSIVLDNQPLEWCSESIRGLRELDLRSICKVDQPSLSSLIAILEACPALELLSLDMAGPNTESHEFGLPIHHVNLPHLRKLTLLSDVRPVAALLSHMTTPNTLRWTINCCNPHDFLDFSLPLSAPILCASLKIHFLYDNGGPRFEPTLHPVGSEQLLFGNRLSFDPEDFSADRLPAEIWLKIFGSTLQNTGWNKTTELTLELSSRPDDRSIWLALFVNLPHLIMLDVVGCGYASTSKEISYLQPLKSPSADLLQTCLCPNLSHLSLLEFGGIRAQHITRAMKDVVEFLKCRDARHARLKRLELKYSENITDAVLKQAKKLNNWVDELVLIKLENKAPPFWLSQV